MGKFFITTPIYYINDKAHIGHAYSTLASDVLARYHRQLGERVLFSTGTDENSQKTVKAAKVLGQDIKVYTDQMVQKWQSLWQTLNISYDRFIRTTEDDHKKSVYALFDLIQKCGDIYQGVYEGLYCEGCEEFIKEEDLVDGLCEEHKKPPQKLQEKNYFFKLSKYQDELLKHIDNNPEFIYPASRKNEVVAFIKRGLDDISITREKQKWGIPFPYDESQIIYVWVEALINYLTVAGFPDKSYQQWWPADVHLVGKGISKFHCIVWPAMLISAGLELPKQVFVHDYLITGGQKISKSLGNVIDPSELAKKYGTDAVRYILLKSTLVGQDSELSMERAESLYNADLANELGNLVQRTVAMIIRYQQGVLVQVPEGVHDVAQYQEAMQTYRFDIALDEVWIAIKSLNQYIEEEKPWQIAKTGDTGHLSEILSYLAGNLRQIAHLLEPFIPDTSNKISTIFEGGKIETAPQLLFPKLEETIKG